MHLKTVVFYMGKGFTFLVALSVSTLQTLCFIILLWCRLNLIVCHSPYLVSLSYILSMLRYAAQLVWFKDESKIVCIPVVVAVVSPFPPSDKIGINSVQREAEEIIPMKQLKMDWVPYIPLENRKHFDVDISDLLYLNFSAFNRESQAALKHLKLDRVKKYEYCLLYFYQPFKEDELEQSTEVQIIFPSELKLEFVKEKVHEAKKANREAREARRKAIAEMSEETKAAFENMRFYKFYPVHSPDAPDVSNVKVVVLAF
ncbi:hypothetical protein TanjilG_09542 [Lupinus angustifolius]|uniref:Uncharacterized protein n=1 Tax=Lupinus angustifolius TaxID=3871 RepID=A0A1J7GUT9_LUPAN|nr:hypothetical protein TanjilG_09542 [Lupinus angustifolius]